MTAVRERLGTLEIMLKKGKIKKIIVECLGEKEYKYKLINGKNMFPVLEEKGNITPKEARRYLALLGYRTKYIPNHQSYSTN
jgi:hypothetical protein